MTVARGAGAARRRPSASSASACRAPPPTSPGARTRPTSCWSTSRARSAPSRRGCRCRSATASWPTPPTRWSACRRSSTTGCRPGRIDVGFLGAAQIDRFGNINTTVIGDDYDDPKVRLPGRAAARRRSPPPAGEVIVVLRQSPRAFVERVDFVTSVGYGDGPGRPRAARACAARGPVMVITDLGVLEPDPDDLRAHADRAAPGGRDRRRAGGDRLEAAGRARPGSDAGADRRRAGRAARAGVGVAPPNINGGWVGRVVCRQRHRAGTNVIRAHRGVPLCDVVVAEQPQRHFRPGRRALV